MNRPNQSARTRRSPILQHAFLQALMQQGFMLETKAKELYKTLYNTVSVDDLLLHNTTSNCRLSASFFFYSPILQSDGKHYIGYVNLAPDDSSKKAGKYKGKDGKPDIRYPAYFRSILEAIIQVEAPPPTKNESTAEAFIASISTKDALNIRITAPLLAGADEDDEASQNAAPSIPELRLGERQSALEYFVSDGWLHQPMEDSSYCLGPRSYLELGSALLEEIDDLPAETKETIEKALGIS